MRSTALNEIWDMLVTEGWRWSQGAHQELCHLFRPKRQGSREALGVLAAHALIQREHMGSGLQNMELYSCLGL